MARKNAVVGLLIERKMTDSDMQFRNQAITRRLDRIGQMLNGFKNAWNAVNKDPNAQIAEKDYEPKEFA